jgi:hypothetical protein
LVTKGFFEQCQNRWGELKAPARKRLPRPTAPPADKFIKAWMIPSPSVFSGLTRLDEPLRAIVT